MSFTQTTNDLTINGPDLGTYVNSGNLSNYIKDPLFNLQLVSPLLANFALSQCGTVTWTGTHLTWTSRVIALPLPDTTSISTSGYFDITVPSLNAFITRFPKDSSTSNQVQVTTNGIPMAAWDGLYYKLPIGNNAFTSLPGNFVIASYGNTAWTPNQNWILLAVFNSDTNSIKWLPGQVCLPNPTAVGQSSVSFSAATGYRSWCPDSLGPTPLTNYATTSSVAAKQDALTVIGDNTSTLGYALHSGTGNITVKSLKAGTNMSFTQTTNDLTINGPNLSGYATTSSLSGYAPLASPTFTGTLTVSGGDILTTNNAYGRVMGSDGFHAVIMRGDTAYDSVLNNYYINAGDNMTFVEYSGTFRFKRITNNGIHDTLCTISPSGMTVAGTINAGDLQINGTSLSTTYAKKPWATGYVSAGQTGGTVIAASFGASTTNTVSSSNTVENGTPTGTIYTITLGTALPTTTPCITATIAGTAPGFIMATYINSTRIQFSATLGCPVYFTVIAQ